MRKDRLSATLVAVALLTALATPALAADAAITPTGPMERVLAFVDGLVKKVQNVVCLVGCEPEAANAVAKSRSEPTVLEIPGEPQTQMTGNGEALGIN